MVNHKKWEIEYSVTLMVILGIVMYFMPLSFESTRQANFTSKWNEMYNKVDYMFQVINAHIGDDMLKSFTEAKTSQEREKLLIQLIKPYLRIDMGKTVSKRYRPKYMNKTRVYKGQDYYFEDLFLTKDNKLVGIKDLPDGGKNQPVFILMFDINGTIPPNTWGKDIFGINMFEDGTIAPFGQGLNMDDLKQDCSASGTGISCAYYYKIGGGFEE
jgi:hypothetical protein